MAESIFCRYLVVFSFFVVIFVHGVSEGDTDTVFVMEGDSLTLNTNVTTNQFGIKWYFHDTRIAQMTGDPSKTCTDVQCNEGTERFRNRLKLDHQTGSLTITNLTTEHSGDYTLKIRSSPSTQVFRVQVSDVPAALREVKMKSVKEGESVTLDPAFMKNTNDVLRWYFNDTLIAEITGDQSEICTDDQCKERFTDRLKVNSQTGSLTITNTRTTDSGLYKLLIVRNGNRFSITSVERFSVNVADPGAVAGIYVAVVLLVVLAVVGVGVAVVVIYHRRKRPLKDNEEEQLQAVEEDVETDGETSMQHDRRGSKEDLFDDSASEALQS